MLLPHWARENLPPADLKPLGVRQRRSGIASEPLGATKWRSSLCTDTLSEEAVLCDAGLCYAFAPAALLSHLALETVAEALPLCHLQLPSVAMALLLHHLAPEECVHTCVRKCCAQKLRSVTLDSDTHSSTPLFYEHVFAQVRMSITLFEALRASHQAG